MPDYPYTCQDCNKRFTVFLTYQEYDRAEISCPHCGSTNVSRRLGRVRFARSEESRLDSLADPSQLAGIEDDPQAMARLMKQMSSEMGEDPGPEFNEVVDRLEKGQSPEQIERDLPDLGDGGMSDFGDD
ncbi:MAG TPA: FmdB family zinc ribbon protein [Anaerolineales bacterium]|jgi:putative FmdB family regulatory protein|nr:FmdB family zinc ribbon protein [Anaerolineales bacterium]